MREMWRRYLDGNPEYLVRNYWWAYLSPVGVWFFSHRTVINLLLFGQYRNILAAVTARLGNIPCPRMLQLTCAYGELTPTLSGHADELHLNDVALIQLQLARRSLSKLGRTSRLARMNAEQLAYATDSFDTLVIFFLLHELPPDARQRTLEESIRVLKPGGQLLLAEYGSNRGEHALHRFAILRRTMERLEPFLHEFRRSDLPAQLQDCAARHNKSLQAVSKTALLGGFYRVMEYRVQHAAP